MSTHTAMDPNASHVHAFYFRRVRLGALQLRRMQNASARARGFRNFAEMMGE